MIDFDKYVLKLAGGVFELRITVTPLVTQPGVAAYDAMGVYTSGALDVAMQNEAIFSDQQTSLGIRLRDFTVPPDRGDLIEISDTRHPHVGLKYWIGDADLDGQGGALLMLRKQEPVE